MGVSHRTRGVRAVVVAAAVLLAVVLPTVAEAHVTVHPTRLPRGATDVELTFRCPNERSDSDSVKLQVFLPVATPLLGVLTDPAPGWSARTTTTTLSTPVRTDDGEVSSAVSEVTWTATGAGVAPGQFADFTLAVGTMPDVTGPLVFKALQTYRDGEVVRWIQVADSLDEDPTTPAPVLTLFTPPVVVGTTVSLATVLSFVALAVALSALVVVFVVVRRRRT